MASFPFSASATTCHPECVSMILSQAKPYDHVVVGNRIVSSEVPLECALTAGKHIEDVTSIG